MNTVSKWITLVAMCLTMNSAFSEEILSARIDSSRQKLVLRAVQSDCNSISPMVKYDISAFDGNGPHYYTLSFASTRMFCPHDKPKSVDIELELPKHPVGHRVTLQTQTQSITYTVEHPLESRKLAVGKKHLLRPTAPSSLPISADDQAPAAAR